jgi:1,2-diacylglycerol 3-beta-galactosyltransferase
MSEDKKKILILMAEAGLGHRSASDALRDACLERYGESCDVIVNNPLDHPKTPKVLQKSQTSYDEIIKHLPDLYKAGYEISDGVLPVTLIEGGLIVALYLTMDDIIRTHRPDLVLITHPIYQAPLNAVLTLNPQFQVPLVTAITDLVTVHHVWFDPNITRCAVPTEEVRQLALKAGLTDQQIIKTGIPVNPRISALQNVDPKELRRELGWDENLTPILVVGSPRMFNLGELLPALDQSEANFQLILVAGGNQDLHTQLEQTSWQHPAKIYHFVDDLPKMMRAAEMIVCKAGGLIVTEALASGLPLVLVDALPGQEVGNAEFVVANDAGAFCTKAEDLQATITKWLANESAVLKQKRKNAARVGKPEAAFKIVDSAWDLAQNFPKGQPIQRRLARTTRLKDLLTRFHINHSGN